MKRETYKAACEQAKAELREILSEFDILRARKEQIERMIAVLEPLSGPEDGIAAHIGREMDKRYDMSNIAEVREISRPRAEEKVIEEAPVVALSAVAVEQPVQEMQPVAATAVAEQPVAMQEGESEEVFEAEEVSSDPIKRRIANALRHRVVLRDNREFNQAFSGGITRW